MEYLGFTVLIKHWSTSNSLLEDRWHENERKGYSKLDIYCKGEIIEMTKSKHQEERQWRERKESQHPHGKVKTFEQLAEDAGKNNSDK